MLNFINNIFGGSGSTLLAAEKLDRRAFIVEQDGRYVNAMIERFKQFQSK